MMAFINEYSCKCLPSELDIFSVPPTLTSMETSDYVEYHPITSIAAGAPIEFDITGNRQDYRFVKKTACSTCVLKRPMHKVQIWEPIRQ